MTLSGRRGRAAFVALVCVALLHASVYPGTYGTSYSAPALFLYALPGTLGAVFAGYRAATSADDDRLGWGVLTVALALTVLVDAAWNISARDGSPPGYPSLFDAAYLASYVLYIAALGLLISPLWRVMDRRWVFDAGAMLAVAGGLAWHFVMPRASDGLTETAVSFTYILLDLGFLVVAGSVGYRSRIAYRDLYLMGAAILLAGGDISYYFKPMAFDSAWNAGLWLIALAAATPTRASVVSPLSRWIRSGAAPPLVVGSMAAVTLFEKSRGHVDDLLIAGVIALALVVARQFVSLRVALAQQREETGFREAVLATQSDLGLAMLLLEDGRVVFVNRAAEHVIGTTADQLKSLPSVVALAFEADRAAWAEWLSDPVGTVDARMARPDGQVIDLEVVARWLQAPGDRRLLLVARDVTARKQSEETLAHAQKLEGLGALAGGVAHDFNNLLSTILGNVALLEMGELDDEARESVESIHAAASRGAGLTRSLLDFSRFQPQQFHDEDLRACLTETVSLARPALPPNVPLHLEVTNAPVPVRADRGQLVQAFLNLIINARDAIGEAGEIAVRVRTTDRFAAVEVSDTGSGMDAATRDRIFEPFFTTKAPGAGTGLGLAISQRTIRDHRGTLDVRSEPGVGTTFTVTLPLNAVVAPG